MLTLNEQKIIYNQIMSEVAKTVKRSLNEDARSLEQEVGAELKAQKKANGKWSLNDEQWTKISASFILDMMHKLDPENVNQPKALERFGQIIKKVKEMHREAELIDIIYNNLD